MRQSKRAATPPSFAPASTATATPPPAKPEQPRAPYDAPWKMTPKPNTQGHILILDHREHCVAAVKGDNMDIVARAKLIVRAPAMRALLSHLRDELKSDDDGARYKAELALIDKELERIGEAPPTGVPADAQASVS